MTCSLILEDRGSPYSPVAEDYDFELDSGLRREQDTPPRSLAWPFCLLWRCCGLAVLAWQGTGGVLISKSTTSPTMELADARKLFQWCPAFVDLRASLLAK